MSANSSISSSHLRSTTSCPGCCLSTLRALLISDFSGVLHRCGEQKTFLHAQHAAARFERLNNAQLNNFERIIFCQIILRCWIGILYQHVRSFCKVRFSRTQRLQMPKTERLWKTLVENFPLHRGSYFAPSPLWRSIFENRSPKIDRSYPCLHPHFLQYANVRM